MKNLGKILIFLLSLTLILTIAGCGSKKDDTTDKNQKPGSSTVTDKNDNDKDSDKDKDSNDDKKPTTDKDTNKDDTTPKPEPKPENTQNPEVKPEKIEITALIGQWQTQVDACEILKEEGIELEGSILINVKTDFGNDNSYRVSISPLEVENTLKTALGNEYDDNFIHNCASTLDDALYESGVYMFEGDILKIKWDGDPEEIEISYTFKGSKNKVVLSFPSDERTFERIL